MIRISKLPLITTPEGFFNTDKILMVDVIHIDKADPVLIEAVKLRPGSFVYEGEWYTPVIMKGSPENLFKNAKEGIPCHLGKGVTVYAYWDGDLKSALEKNKIYDFTAYYTEGSAFNVMNEPDFLCRRYVRPYLSSGIVK